MMQQDGLLGKADHRAQRRFRSALGAYFATGSWVTRETALYLEGERLAKDLRVEADWEQAKAEFDALQDADHDYHLLSDAPRFDCDDCAEDTAAWWTRNMASY